MLKTSISRLLFTACLAGVLSLVGCDKKEDAPPKSSASDQAAEEITRRIQEPQDKARALEGQMLEQDQQRREAIDKM